MPRYEVQVIVNMATTWEAENADQAIALADEWVGEEYGNLKHKTDYSVRELI